MPAPRAAWRSALASDLLSSASSACNGFGGKNRRVFEQAGAREVRTVIQILVSRRKANGFFGLPNNFIEEQLKVVATTRNSSTVTTIVSIPGQGDK